MLMIRPYTPADADVVESMVRDAFWDVYKPGCDEHYLVHNIHERNAAAPGLDLVAVRDNKIVGHVVCVPAVLATQHGIYADVLCLGPLAVRPDHQRQGIGATLLKEVSKLAAEQRWRAIFLVGSTAYYPRFGYRSISDFDLTLEDGSAFDEQMVLPLRPDAFSEAKNGRYADPSIYISPDAEKVAAFDTHFPPREKHVLPTQLFKPREE